MTNTVTLFGQQVGREPMVRFKRAYEAAHADKAETFQFDGQEVLTKFAKYVVEHAENQMGAL